MGENMQMPKGMATGLYAVLYLAGAYCALFLLLMDPRFSAFDGTNWTKEYHASYRFNRMKEIPRDLIAITWESHTTTFANRFFSPLDWVTHRAFPSVSGQMEPFPGVPYNESP
jgi:hypothetical protein